MKCVIFQLCYGLMFKHNWDSAEQKHCSLEWKQIKLHIIFKYGSTWISEWKCNRDKHPFISSVCNTERVCGSSEHSGLISDPSRGTSSHLTVIEIWCFYGFALRKRMCIVTIPKENRVNPVNTQLQIQPNQQDCLSARETRLEDTIKSAVNLIKLIRKISCRENINGC